jgi:5-deoxy-glucuronate isomerase
MTSPLLRRAHPPDELRRINEITPATAGWTYLSYAVHRLRDGEEIRRRGDDQEVAVVVLEGSADVGAAADRWPGLGSRASVFDGPPPPVLLVQPGRDLVIRGSSAEALVAVTSAPGGEIRVTRLTEPGQIRVEERGSGVTARRVHHLLPPAAEAGRLILFEVFTPGGNWSSYPPHKHDTQDPPRESALEELYHYKFARPTGFAFARVYSDDRSLDEAMTPIEDDLVLVPRGYHPVGMPAGYDGWYLNAMAGPTRLWHFTLDPDHAWLMDWSPT